MEEDITDVSDDEDFAISDNQEKQMDLTEINDIDFPQDNEEGSDEDLGDLNLDDLWLD